MTLKDIIANGEELNQETSSKHGKIWIECYFGYPGLYQYYTFGIFGGPVGAFNNKFPNGNELENETTLNLKANYISISTKSGEGAHFDFWAMV